MRLRGCSGSSGWAGACDAHHIIWWDDNGTTDIPNLVLLCPKCHRKVHKHGYQVAANANGQHQLIPPERPTTGKQPRGPTQTAAA